MLRKAAALLVLCFASLVQAAPVIGEPSPVDLLGTTPEGEQIRISEHRGKVMVVSFWASWCGYCRRQFPLLEHVQDAVGPARLRVVVVNYQEPASDYRRIRRTLRKSPVTWTHDSDGALSDVFGVDGVPYMLIFDKAGDLAAVRGGYSEESAAQTIAILNELLAEPDPRPVAPADDDVVAPQASAAGGA
ncbi:TlpA family protein disulfide reductase [Luteimonas sp. A482]